MNGPFGSESAHSRAALEVRVSGRASHESFILCTRSPASEQTTRPRQETMVLSETSSRRCLLARRPLLCPETPPLAASLASCPVARDDGGPCAVAAAMPGYRRDFKPIRCTKPTAFRALRLTAAANVETIVRAGIHAFPHDVIDAMNAGATRIRQIM
jgi:hypothetical protein